MKTGQKIEKIKFPGNGYCTDAVLYQLKQAHAVSHCHSNPLKCQSQLYWTGPRSAVGNVSGYRCVADCRSRGREFDPGPVPYFRGD